MQICGLGRGWLVCGLLVIGCGDDGPVSTKLTGAVQKGPFVLGSSLALSPVDGTGNPTGQVFMTETIDDLGDFALNLTYQGNASIEGVGYYYNEVTGQLSSSSLTLRAFYNVTATGTQHAYVNIITHLTYARVRAILTLQGGSVANAVTQAETELRQALGIGGANFNPMTAGVSMNLLGGDNDADAYVFAVSAILAQIAKDNANGGSVDAALQELINRTSSTFATSGALDPALVAQVHQVQIDHKPQPIMDLLRQRLTDLQSNAPVPNLNRVWDSDGDGRPNSLDNCGQADGLHNDGNGYCVEMGCASGFHDDGNGTCVAAGCATGFHDDGAGACVAMGCAANFHDGGSGICVPVGTCSPNFHDGGDGACAANGSCSTGYHIVTGGTCASNFAAPVAYAVGPGVKAMAAKDLNGDGHLDLVVTAYMAQSVSVLMGNGDGTFGAAASYPVCTNCGTSAAPLDLAIADFNNDGKPDIAASAESLNLAVLLGDGTGAFSISSGLSSPHAVMAVTVADFNGDTRPDVAAACGGGSLDGAMEVFLDTATGLGGPTSFSSLTMLQDVVAADFNNDGHADVLVLHNNGNNNGAGGEIYLGNGDGTFQPATTFVTMPQNDLFDAAVGDFNGDSKPDVIIAGQETPETPMYFYAVLLGNGDGTFAVTTYDAPVTTRIAVGDFNRDGHPDIVLGSYLATGGVGVSVAFGNGDGTFQPFAFYSITPTPGTGVAAIAIGDFNGDSKPDIAVAEYTSNGTADSVIILLNQL